VGPPCSFCGITRDPSSRWRPCSPSSCAPLARPPAQAPTAGLPNTGIEMIDPDQPSELLAHHDPGEPWLKWRWPIPGCGHPVMRPRDLEPHTAAEHAGWSASWHASRCGVSTAVERLTWNTEGPACGHQIRSLGAAGKLASSCKGSAG
jgi:hypothetical protein